MLNEMHLTAQKETIEKFQFNELNILGNKLNLFTVSLFPIFLLRTEKEKSDRLEIQNLTDWTLLLRKSQLCFQGIKKHSLKISE